MKPSQGKMILIFQGYAVFTNNLKAAATRAVSEWVRALGYVHRVL